MSCNLNDTKAAIGRVGQGNAYKAEKTAHAKALKQK